ncbi:MAG: alkaline phosphatase family protein [Acidobacteria bacterium]|nr:alkaline phosphatase family protein [Acidobacteriota bacterium]
MARLVPHPRAAFVVAAVTLVAPAAADAYIGPGAGFAVMSSFLVMLVTMVVVVASVLAWPFRAAWRLVTRRGPPPSTIDRFIVIGFDGQDPTLTDDYLKQGLLPNFAKLQAQGAYRRLQTTYPALSPVAWSSFSTGTHPGRHNIFDFLDRDRRTYLPLLSSTRIGKVERFLKLGKYLIPRERPALTNLRRSKPFWTILGERRIWSTVLRVPITFPPDRFYGAELSAMSVPDLLGTQGTFLLFTTRPPSARFKEGGQRVPVELVGDRIDTVVTGPENGFVVGHPPLTCPLTLVVDRALSRATITTGGASVTLGVGELSGWLALPFPAAPGVTVSGIARVQVLELGAHVSLYMSPINLDPEEPAMPISHPGYYAGYLAKRHGPYATLGLAEDTWALNEGVTDDATFLKQAHDIDDERRRMFLTSLGKLRRGSLVCVFDGTDRIQHMFWRYIDPKHPAHRSDAPAEHRDAIKALYQKNDRLVGEVMATLGPRDLLMVISDHGFSSFRRGVNLNAWLLGEGYLALKEGTDGSAEWLRDVDWAKTRAYCLGLSGLFLNLRGREASGIVAAGEEARALKAELIAKLARLPDRGGGDVGVREAFDTTALYQGPYSQNAPDLVIGYNAGYRTSWDCATGMVSGPVFEDNTKAWSGDHCIDPRLVPGVVFCNRPIEESRDLSIVDIAPTALRLFGLTPPPHMDGRPWAVAP